MPAKPIAAYQKSPSYNRGRFSTFLNPLAIIYSDKQRTRIPNMRVLCCLLIPSIFYPNIDEELRVRAFLLPVQELQPDDQVLQQYEQLFQLTVH